MPETAPVTLPDQPSKGLATKSGYLATALLAVFAVVTAIVNGDHSSETIASLAGAVWTLSVTVGGRMYQAAAMLRSVAPYIEAAAGGLGTTRTSPDLRDDAGYGELEGIVRILVFAVVAIVLLVLLVALVRSIA